MKQVNVLIACNSFKESLSSQDVNKSVEKGFRLFEPLTNISFSIRKKSICDGGTGFATIMAEATGGFLKECSSFNPRMKKINSHYGVSADRTKVFIEVAQTGGLALLNLSERNPLQTSSFGVGIQIKDAISCFSPDEIYIGCGDTALNDYGIGMLSALGMTFFSSMGEYKPLFPTDILSVTRFNYTDELTQLLTTTQIFVCGNLSSIVGGKSGTSNVYAKQKGATESDIQQLNLIKEHFVDLSQNHFNEDVSYLPGSGAGGGIGAAAYLYLGAKLTYSFETIFRTIGLEQDIKWSNIVITGEGLLDLNSLKGKAPIAVALHAKKFNRNVGLVAGAIASDCSNVLLRAGVDYVEPLTHSDININNYMVRSNELISQASFRLASKLF